MTDFDDDDEDGRLPADFDWFDRYCIPQYERLVSEGLVSQEEADRYKALRVEMGLPMEIDQLEPRPASDPDRCPVAAFEWLAAVGGPPVTVSGQRVELLGEVWHTSMYGEATLMRHTENADGSLLMRGLSPPYKDESGLRWNCSLKLPGGVNIYARTGDNAETLAAALTAVHTPRFAVVIMNGLTFFTEQEDARYVAAYNGEALRLTRHNTLGDNDKWYWELHLPEGSVMRALAETFGAYSLRGHALTLEQAACDAVGRYDHVIALSAQVLGNKPYSLGYTAGWNALKARVATLSDGDGNGAAD